MQDAARKSEREASDNQVENGGGVFSPQRNTRSAGRSGWSQHLMRYNLIFLS
jgi:hypothetical protein